jgi:glyoxylase I family protein
LTSGVSIVKLLRTHHVAVICSDYERSRRFYVETLGLEVVAEVHRRERDSYKLDLRLPDGTQIELFSFPDPPKRPSYPEACGLRHLAFEVADVHEAVRELEGEGVGRFALTITSRGSVLRRPGWSTPGVGGDDSCWAPG